MSFLVALLYDQCMANAEEACLKEWRQELLKQVSGEVLEVGAGTGANIRFYSDNVTKLVLAEPDKHMRKFLRKKIKNLNLANVAVASDAAEHIDANNESFDYVVASLVCCSVRDIKACLHEISRVLKPDGSLVFLEHVAAAEGTLTRRWQNRINPIWKTLLGNCHLNRETEQAILDEGFEIIQIKRESLRDAPSIVRPTIRGVAKKANKQM